MSSLMEQLDELLPELLGEDARKAKKIRDEVFRIMVQAGRELMQTRQAAGGSGRVGYIIESQDDPDMKAFRLFLASIEDDYEQAIRLFDNLTEYEAAYWLKYKKRIMEEWAELARQLTDPVRQEN